MYFNLYNSYRRMFEPIPSTVFEPDVEYPEDIYRSEPIESNAVEAESTETQPITAEEYNPPSEDEDILPSSEFRSDHTLPFKQSFTMEEAHKIAEELGIDFDTVKFDIDQFRIGLDVELEHGMKDLHTNITGDDPILTGKIALVHLSEIPNYYTRLAYLEAQAKNM